MEWQYLIPPFSVASALHCSIGRCIRHRDDYGVILLLDPRYRATAIQMQLSKWVRGAVRNFNSCREASQSMQVEGPVQG